MWLNCHITVNKTAAFFIQKISLSISWFYAFLQHVYKITATLEGQWLEPVANSHHFCSWRQPLWLFGQETTLDIRARQRGNMGNYIYYISNPALAGLCVAGKYPPRPVSVFQELYFQDNE